MPADYYQTLELPRSASARDIKHAYRRLARKYHPDFNPGDPAAEDRMEEINRAYEVLSDKRQREEYDRYHRQSAPRYERQAETPPPKETFDEAARRAAAIELLSPYEILGVSPRASYREVRDAFADIIAFFGDSAISDPGAALAYQHVKSAYYVLSNYERRRRYNAEHALPDPPLPEEEDDDNRPLGVLDGLGDLAWIVPVSIGIIAILVALFAFFEPYWLR